MRLKINLILVLSFLLLTTSSVYAQGNQYTLWIHGKNKGNEQGVSGDVKDFRYWGDEKKAKLNPDRPVIHENIAVNWDGVSRISAENGKIIGALDCYCTGRNWCYIAAHSAGNLQIGYALAKYGSSNRRISEPFPLGVTKTTDGLCLRKAGGQTQKGWNIKYVDIAGGAGGGSEAAGGPTPAGFLVYGPAAQLTAWGIGAAVGGIISDLQTATARSMYDHNQTQGIKFNMYLGADARSVNGVALSRVLPGSNDGAVAYHSQGGVSKRARYCNNGSQGCPDINYGNAKTETGDAKWSNHYVKHQDIDHKLSHFLNEKWEGVTSALLKDHLKK